MTAPSVLDLEEPLRDLGAAIGAVHLIADSMDEPSQEKAALDWICYKMAADHKAAKAWFDATVEAKGTCPVAVT